MRLTGCCFANEYRKHFIVQLLFIQMMTTVQYSSNAHTAQSYGAWPCRSSVVKTASTVSYECYGSHRRHLYPVPNVGSQLVAAILCWATFLPILKLQSGAGLSLPVYHSSLPSFGKKASNCLVAACVKHSFANTVVMQANLLTSSWTAGQGVRRESLLWLLRSWWMPCKCSGQTRKCLRLHPLSLELVTK